MYSFYITLIYIYLLSYLRYIPNSYSSTYNTSAVCSVEEAMGGFRVHLATENPDLEFFPSFA